MKKILYLMISLILISAVSAARVSVRPRFKNDKYEPLYIQIYNNGKDDLDNVQVTLFIPDLNLYEPSSSFTVNDGDSHTERFFLELDAEPGYYPVRISINGEDTNQVRWTWLSLS